MRVVCVVGLGPTSPRPVQGRRSSHADVLLLTARSPAPDRHSRFALPIARDAEFIQLALRQRRACRLSCDGGPHGCWLPRDGVVGEADLLGRRPPTTHGAVHRRLTRAPGALVSRALNTNRLVAFASPASVVLQRGAVPRPSPLASRPPDPRSCTSRWWVLADSHGRRRRSLCPGRHHATLLRPESLCCADRRLDAVWHAAPLAADSPTTPGFTAMAFRFAGRCALLALMLALVMTAPSESLRVA